MIKSFNSPRYFAWITSIPSIEPPAALQVVGDSPGAELLLRLSQESRVQRPRSPRCLGLTASYANDGAKTWEDFLQSRRTLQVAPDYVVKGGSDKRDKRS